MQHSVVVHVRSSHMLYMRIDQFTLIHDMKKKTAKKDSYKQNKQRHIWFVCVCLSHILLLPPLHTCIHACMRCPDFTFLSLAHLAVFGD